MIENIDKVTQRGDKLEDINERAGTVCVCVRVRVRACVCARMIQREKE